MVKLEKHIENITEKTDLSNILSEVGCVIHCASDNRFEKQIKTSKAVNFSSDYLLTQNLARQCVACGVNHFVFLSSLKVNGEWTIPGHPFSEKDVPVPQSSYGRSKWEIEKMLSNISDKSDLRLTIIRPPLIYGPGVKGNFLRLIRMVDKGFPLPLGNINNRRSILSVNNLVDFVLKCIHREALKKQTFLISDGVDISTPQLLEAIGEALGKPPILFSMPLPMVRFGMSMINRESVANRLFKDLQLNMSFAQNVLGWEPKFNISEEITSTVKWYQKTK